MQWLQINLPVKQQEAQLMQRKQHVSQGKYKYPLGAGTELKGYAVVGLRKIYIALARFI